MVMSWIWTGIVAVSLLCGALNGRGSALVLVVDFVNQYSLRLSDGTGCFPGSVGAAGCPGRRNTCNLHGWRHLPVVRHRKINDGNWTDRQAFSAASPSSAPCFPFFKTGYRFIWSVECQHLRQFSGFGQRCHPHGDPGCAANEARKYRNK